MSETTKYSEVPTQGDKNQQDSIAKDDDGKKSPQHVQSEDNDVICLKPKMSLLMDVQSSLEA